MDYKECKDCDRRHPHCHSKCPEYAKMKEERAAIAEAKKTKRIGTDSIGRVKGITAFRKYQHRIGKK